MNTSICMSDVITVIQNFNLFFFVFGFCSLTELAWQSHFVTNMFIRPSTTPSNDFAPDFTVINACKVVNDNWEKHGLNSEVFIAFNVEKKVAIIGGTW